MAPEAKGVALIGRKSTGLRSPENSGSYAVERLWPEADDDSAGPLHITARSTPRKTLRVLYAKRPNRYPVLMRHFLQCASSFP